MSSVSYAQLLRENRNFRLYWGGQIVSQLGDWFNVVVIQALLLRYTGGATSIAAFMIAQMLPQFLLGPFAGVVVDRLPRKWVMIGADVARALIALGLLGLRGPETVWVAYVCVAGLASFTAFFEPARTAVLPSITEGEELITANALSSVTWSILLTSGAIVGAVVARFLGSDVAFLLNSFSFVGSALLLARLEVPPTTRDETHAHGFGQIADGFRYVGRHSEILGALTAKLFWGLAGGIQALIALYGQRLYPLPNDPNGVLSIGVLLAASGVGTALGPVVIRRITGRDPHRIRWAIALSFLMGGFYYVLLPIAPNLGVVAGLLFLARFHGAVIWVFSTILLQLLAKDQFRGRVFAAETSLFTGSMMTSNLVTTQVLDRGWATVPQAALAMGVVSLLSGALWVARMARPAERIGEGHLLRQPERVSEEAAE